MWISSVTSKYMNISFPVDGASVRIFVTTCCVKHCSVLWPWGHLRWLSQADVLLDLLKAWSIWKGLWKGQRKPLLRDGFQHPVLTSGSQVPLCCAGEPTWRVRCWECAAPSPDWQLCCGAQWVENLESAFPNIPAASCACTETQHAFTK